MGLKAVARPKIAAHLTRRSDFRSGHQELIYAESTLPLIVCLHRPSVLARSSLVPPSHIFPLPGGSRRRSCCVRWVAAIGGTSSTACGVRKCPSDKSSVAVVLLVRGCRRLLGIENRPNRVVRIRELATNRLKAGQETSASRVSNVERTCPAIDRRSLRTSVIESRCCRAGKR